MGTLLLALASSAAAQGLVRVDRTVENGQWKIEVLTYERSNRRADYRLKIKEKGLVFWKVRFRFLNVPALAKRIKDAKVYHRLDYTLNGERKSILSRRANINIDGTIELLFTLPPEAALTRLLFNAEVSPKYRHLWTKLPPLELR